MIMISTPILVALNHLLAQEDWARTKLAVHAGKVARFDLGAIVLTWRSNQAGLFEFADHETQPNVTIRAKLSDLPLIAQNRERAFSYVKIEGDADFANVISQLSQALRWEAEEDLSKWVGDIAANRIVAGTKSVMHTAQSTGQKFAENVAEYFLDEKPLLVRPAAVSRFANDVAALRDDVERLVKRIEKLEVK